MEVKFITTKLSCGQNGYGINFRSGAPVLVDTVLPSSPAAHGGLRFGDMLVELNGNDIFSFSKESLISAIKACNRDTLRLRVGRVRPTPITVDARKEAVRFVKNKLESGNNRRSVEVLQYQDKLSNSMAEVEDLLKSFDLPLAIPTAPQGVAGNSRVPGNAWTSVTKDSGQGEQVEEVQVAYDDDDSLPSPPSSGSSEADLNEQDPLLDFSREDKFEFTSPGRKKTATKKARSQKFEGPEGPQMMKATMELKRGLDGFKTILQSAERTYDEKQSRRRIELQNDKPEARQAVTTASFPTTRQRGGVVTDRKPDSMSKSVAVARQGEKRNGSATGPSGRELPPEAPPSRSNGYGVRNGAVASPTRRDSPAQRLPSPSKVVSPSYTSSYQAMPPPSGAANPLPRVPVSSYRSSPLTAGGSTVTTPTAPLTNKSPHSKSRPPNVKPAPYTGSLMSPTSKTTPSSQDGDEVLTTYQKKPSPVRENPRDQVTKNEPLRTTVEQVPPPRGKVMVGMSMGGARATSNGNRRSVSSSRSPSISPPPPVPAYSPAEPDPYPLSNQQNYIRRKESPGKAWEAGEVRRSSGESREKVVQERVDMHKMKSKGRRRSGGEERASRDAITGSRSRGSLDLHQPVPSGKKEKIIKISSLEASCSGLPDSVTDWSQEDVLQWLQQLSPALSDLYGHSFSHHSIIGRTLLRLTAAKLKKMEVNSKHSTVLAGEIAKLKMRQEKLELEELESSELSYL